MRVCIIVEGCYPYTVGGVSAWIHELINSFPNLEFVLLTIVTDRSWSGRFKYELPQNVTEVHELYLQDDNWEQKKKKQNKALLNEEEYQALRSLVLNQDVQWEVLYDMFQKRDFSIEELLMGEDFFNIAGDCGDLYYPQIVFTDLLWSLRSIYLPFFFTLRMKIPKADLYHCIATGYAGVLGCMAKHIYGSNLIISEHGIYTREREEELIKADWVQGIYKDIWIGQFKKMAKLAYEKADIVTSLYEDARLLQIEMGCPPQKTRVTHNGIDVDSFADIPGKTQEDEDFINVGAVLRIAPIKDVKTLLSAYNYAKMKNPKLKLWIMGPWDGEEEYAEECFEYAKMLNIPDVIFTGQVDVRKYLGRMDFTILTSISEGQPMAVLESFAVQKPVIATNVGNCRGLVYGEGDDFGPAGIITHVMDVEEIENAILKLASAPELCMQMGKNGYRRVSQKHKISDMQAQYRKIYHGLSLKSGIGWNEEAFVPKL